MVAFNSLTLALAAFASVSLAAPTSQVGAVQPAVQKRGAHNFVMDNSHPLIIAKRNAAIAKRNAIMPRQANSTSPAGGSCPGTAGGSAAPSGVPSTGNSGSAAPSGMPSSGNSGASGSTGGWGGWPAPGAWPGTGSAVGPSGSTGGWGGSAGSWPAPGSWPGSGSGSGSAAPSGSPSTGDSGPSGSTGGWGGSGSAAPSGSTGGYTGGSSTSVAASTSTGTSSTGSSGSGTSYVQDYTTGGTVDFTHESGDFSLNFDTTEDFVVGIGWNPGSSDPITHTGSFAVTSGLGTLSVYGWSENPLVEYYVIENSQGFTQTGTQMGTFETDGSTYTVWEHQQVNQPSITGTNTFNQYISIRDTPRSSGTVTVENHFNQWKSYGMDLGDLNLQVVAVESWNGAGSAQQTVSN